MKLIRHLLSLAAISLLATSCASFSGNKLPKVADTPVTNAKKVSLTYTLKYGSGATRNNVDSRSYVRSPVEKPLINAFNESGRFTSVTPGKGGAVHVDVDVLNHGNKGVAMASGFISGFSLFTIPGFGTDHYKMTATARTASGKSREYVMDESMTMVLWLPMIVVSPFASPTAVFADVHENMYRNLILNMERDGLLPKASD